MLEVFRHFKASIKNWFDKKYQLHFTFKSFYISCFYWIFVKSKIILMYYTEISLSLMKNVLQMFFFF